jgi:type IV pilus assembly protein PilN
MIKINLLPVEEKKKVEGRGEFLLGVFVIVFVLALVVVVHIIQSRRIEEVKRQTLKVEKEIKELEEVKKKVDEFKAKNKELEETIRVIAVLEENRTGPLYVMDALANSIPDRAWIDKFSEKSNKATIEGVAWDEFTVASFMKGLQSSPYFKNVELRAIKTKEIQQLPLKAFVIETMLDYSGKVAGKGNKSNGLVSQ